MHHLVNFWNACSPFRQKLSNSQKPQITKMFGFYAFSGKATAFLGPALLGMITVAFDSQRAGMASILVFFIVGIFLLTNVQESNSLS